MRNGVTCREKYSAKVRLFCFKMHSISPRAYAVLRSQFNNNLPHVSTIKSWYRNSDIDSEPGINMSSMRILKQKVSEMEENNQKLVCTLAFDEMFIRKHNQWCSKTKKFIGKVTHGKNMDEIANNAIVFLITGINAKIQVPVAYEFITSLDGNERAKMVLKILDELHKCGVIIANITFDGLFANKSMCEALGCVFKRGKMKTYFIDPHSQRRIFVVFDPSHCIKLIRTNLHGRKVLVDADGGVIQWKHIESLFHFGKNNDFNLTHKLTNRHINFQNKKMHVRTAVQTLSNSVADSLQFLMGQNVNGFSTVGPTVKHIRYFDKLFDIMNTQKVNHSQENCFKSAINFFNQEEVFEFLNEAKEYIFGLKVRGLKQRRLVPIVSSLIKTGYLGMAINIDSIIGMYHEFVQEKELMHALPTYRLSQDHIEMLFGKIRAYHRFNDNPTQQQFKASYKRIQLASDIPLSAGSNISTNILEVSSKKTENAPDTSHHFDDQLELERDEAQCLFHSGSINFVGFEIESRLLKANGCIFCKKVLQDNVKVIEQNCIGKNIPCESTFALCKATDQAIKHSINHANENFSDQIINLVMRSVHFDELYPCFFENEHDQDHKHFLIRFIINEYIHIKCTFLSKQKNINMHQTYLRHAYRKVIHRKGQ